MIPSTFFSFPFIPKISTKTSLLINAIDTMALLHLQTPKAKRCRIMIPSHKAQHQHLHCPRKPTPTPSPMEEMMMVMMTNISSRRHELAPCNNPNDSPICPTWKLYENPFYISNQKPYCQDRTNQQQQQQIHRLHLPVSARKIAASFWDLAFIRPPPVMESELEKAKTRIDELRSELEMERKARRKSEALSKRLARELSEERKGRQALEKVCEELAKEISSDKKEIGRMRKEFDEERRMLRTAEVIREERVQMKLAEAKILLEEKFSALETAGKFGNHPESSLSQSSNFNKESKTDSRRDWDGCQASSLRGKLRLVLGEKKLPAPSDSHPMAVNPHIRRGIKGFVEFPRVVRAIGCRSGKQLGSKLECQKAQLKILMKQKGPVRINGVITS